MQTVESPDVEHIILSSLDKSIDQIIPLCPKNCFSDVIFNMLISCIILLSLSDTYNFVPVWLNLHVVINP